MFNIGPQELLIVLVLALIVVGPQKLPELSRQIGRGLREFRKVQDDVKGMVKFDLDDTPDRQAPARSAAASATTGPPSVHRTTRPAPTATATPTSDPAVRAPGSGEGDPPPAAPPG